MSDPTTTTTYTPTESAAARERIAILDAEMRDDPSPEGATSRTRRIDEKLRLIPVAYAEEPALPDTGLPLSARVALTDERRRLYRELAAIPEGHPDRQLILDRQLEIAGDLHRQEIEAAARPTAMIDLVPAEVRGEAWAPELLSAARSLGLESAIPALLHVAIGEVNGGRLGWSDEEAIDELERRHGPEKAAAIVADAKEASRHLLPARFRGWLEGKRLLANPALVEHVARVWRRRPGAANR
jgi:hypothetical protein